MSGLESLPLHDAILQNIVLLWEERVVEIELLPVAERGKKASPHKLRFTSVKNFSCPHTSPWGESFYINEANGTAGSFSIEMQSGDEIRIEALEFSFNAVTS